MGIDINEKPKKQYSDELKKQIIKECQETGNVAIVARRYNTSSNTIHSWIKKYRKTGSMKTLPRGEKDRNKILEKQLQQVSIENDRLKRLLAEKELELTILKDFKRFN